MKKPVTVAVSDDPNHALAEIQDSIKHEVVAPAPQPAPPPPAPVTVKVTPSPAQAKAPAAVEKPTEKPEPKAEPKVEAPKGPPVSQRTLDEMARGQQSIAGR